MKWYWIALISVSVLALGYLVWVSMPKKTTSTKTTIPPLGNVGDSGGVVTPG